ncbi:hypothetical protein F8M41_000193 [Gigaspora margarita]|uniref:Uncharacterized protein n=1 Tax=Gigaspora margarita TaxID=4874 RepID=A0A8H4AAC0_GIGMA|nr:hypothetical protein F8M41_000193 [Gigaspora margarita]
MEPIYIGSNSDSTNTDNYEPIVNYESDDDYEFNDNESIYNESEIEFLVANLTESNSYSPFDEYEVIATQSSKLVNNDNMNSNYDNDSLINLITENLRVGEISYSAFPIEYPPTSEQGIAIMQYQRGRPSGGGNTKVWCTFLDCNVHKYYSTCQGVK